MTLRALAEECGVSVGTVSKAFSGSSEISEATREKIFAAAKENGVFDKYNKHKFQKPVIAVLCPEVRSEYYAGMIGTLQEEITARGGVMCVSLTDFGADKEYELFKLYSSYLAADGILLINLEGDPQNVENIPAVALGTKKNVSNIDTIGHDFGSGIRHSVAFLKENGHRAIGFASEELTGSKLGMFKDAMRQYGLEVRDEWLYVSSSRFEEAGLDAVRHFLALSERPDTIVAAYDYIAIGVIKGLHAAGLRVPEDISVLGMDDISLAPYFETPISSIRTGSEEACRIAVELLFKKLENRFFHARQKLSVPSRFIARESVKRNIE